MMIRQIEKKWIKNFRKSPLIDRSNGAFLGNYAHQLFYGRQDEHYPRNFPNNFFQFYNSCEAIERNAAIAKLVIYLDFVGIRIRQEAIQNHLDKFPNDFTKLIRKCYYILKTLAHYGSHLNAEKPFQDNQGDLYFLLRIESGESVLGGQLHLFEDLELPSLYTRIHHIPPGYGEDSVIAALFEMVENSSNCFFITGKAGTGKSTFIHYFAQTTKKKVLMMAFTGIAAMNVGGQTIHSFFRFPFKPLMPEDDEIKIFAAKSPKYALIKEIDTIVIDEVSMLRSDILGAIDYSLRNNGGDPNKTFGGKQILFIGDVFQLPPVRKQTDETEEILFSEIYPSEYFFDTPAFQQAKPKFFEFEKSHRQREDLPFVQLLDDVRICRVNALTLQKLNERYDPSCHPRLDEFVITLTATKAVANSENLQKLLALSFTKFTFEAQIAGEFKEEEYPTDKVLELKKNAQVIFIKNDSLGGKWVNGTIAKIDFISSEFIEVRLPDQSIQRIERASWENRRYKYDKEKRKIVSEVIGTFTQFPIKLAWAITIHKSQGLTFDKVIIDLGTGAFVNGQLYTALSRCKKLDGITLRKKLRLQDIITDQRIIDFYYALNSVDLQS